MKKFFFILLLVVATWSAQAQNATAIFNKVVADYKASGTVSASYTMAGSKGTIVMSGSKFRVLAGNLKAWYDGKTQWTYTTATGEVNVTEPTAQELVMVNPLSAAQTLMASYNMSAKKAGAGFVLTLTPKKRNNVKSITLHISSAYRLTKASYATSKGTQSLLISNYKTHVASNAGTFKFQKSMVPAGTEVIDLR